MKRIVILVIGLFLCLGAGFLISNALDDETYDGLNPDRIEAIKIEIEETLSQQDLAWNQGDIPAFMEFYWNSDRLRFASGGSVEMGWKSTQKRYAARYPDRSAMGELAFTDLEITVFSKRDALVFGKWSLKREDGHPNGLFTLHMHKFGEDWKIVSDHTSSAD